MRVRSIILFAALSTLVLVITGVQCTKDSEEDLRITTDALSSSETPGPDFSFNLTVESQMPRDGVWINFVVRGESDNQPYPQINTETGNKTTLLRIVNLPRQKFCICTVTIISKKKSENKATTSFRVVYK